MYFYFVYAEYFLVLADPMFNYSVSNDDGYCIFSINCSSCNTIATFFPPALLYCDALVYACVHLV